MSVPSRDSPFNKRHRFVSATLLGLRFPQHRIEPYTWFGYAEGEPGRQRLDRLEMDVVERRRLVPQFRRGEIIDLVGAGIIEQVENVEPEPRLLGQFVPDA